MEGHVAREVRTAAGEHQAGVCRDSLEADDWHCEPHSWLSRPLIPEVLLQRPPLCCKQPEGLFLSISGRPRALRTYVSLHPRQLAFGTDTFEILPAKI